MIPAGGLGERLGFSGEPQPHRLEVCFGGWRLGAEGFASGRGPASGCVSNSSGANGGSMLLVQALGFGIWRLDFEGHRDSESSERLKINEVQSNQLRPMPGLI